MAEKELEMKGEDVRAMLRGLAPAAEDIMKGFQGLEIIDARTAKAVDMLKVTAERLDKELPQKATKTATSAEERVELNLKFFTERAQRIEKLLTESGVDEVTVAGKGYQKEAGEIRGLLTGGLSEAVSDKPKQQKDIEIIEGMIREAESKTVGLGKIIQQEQAISDAPEEERGKLVGALRDSFRDFGKGTQARGELILDAIETYSQNQLLLNPKYSEQLVSAENEDPKVTVAVVAEKTRTDVVGLVVRLGESARKGEEFTAAAAKEAREILGGIKVSVGKLLETVSNFRANNLNRFVNDLLSLQTIANASDDYKKAITTLYDKLKKLAAEVGRKERKLSDREYAELDEEMKMLDSVSELLSRTPASVRGSLGGIYGRMLNSLSAGNREVAKIHAFIALQFLTADKEKRKELEKWSIDLSSGKITSAEVCSNLGKYVVGKIYGTLASIDPELRKYITRFTTNLHGNNVSVTDLERAVTLLGFTKTMRTFLADCSKESKPELLLIFGRALFSFENGLPIEEQMQQMALARSYLRAEKFGEEGKKLQAQLRVASIELYRAARLELVTTHMQVKGANLIEVLRELNFADSEIAIISKSSLAQIEKQANELRFAYGTFTQSANMFVALTERAQDAKSDGEKTLYSRALGFIHNILDRISNRDFPPREELIKLSSMNMFFFGSKEELFTYLVGSEPQSERQLASRFLSQIREPAEVLAKARKQQEYEQSTVFGLYTLALESILGNRLDAAQARMLSAQAYIGASASERAVINEYGHSDFEGRYSVKIKSPVTGTDLTYKPAQRSENETKFLAYIELSRQSALAQVKEPKERNNVNAYYDIATVLFLRNDAQGAELSLNVAQLYGDAVKDKKNKDNRDVVQVMAFAHSVLGDYSTHPAKLLEMEQHGQLKTGSVGGLVGQAMADNKKVSDYVKSQGLLADAENSVLPTLPKALAFMQRVSPDKRFERLNGEINLFRLTLVGTDLDDRAEKMLGSRDPAQKSRIQKRYEAEQRRLDLLIKKEPAGLNRDRLILERERADYGKMEKRIEEARVNYRKAMEQIQKDRLEGKAPSRETITLLNFSVSALEALRELHTSIGTIRTQEREKGRMHLERAAVVYLEMGSTLAVNGKFDASKVEEAEHDLKVGSVLFRQQQGLQTYAEVLAVDIKRQKEINEGNNQRNLEEEIIITPPMFYGGKVERKKSGKLVSKLTNDGKPVVQYDKRKKQLERAELLLSSGRVLEAAAALNTARSGIAIDRAREENERLYYRLYKGVSVPYEERVQKRTVNGKVVLVGYNYENYVKRLENLEQRLESGATRYVEREISILLRDIRFGNATGYLLYQKKAKQQMLESAQSLADRARKLGQITYEERVERKKQDLEALTSQEEAVALMHSQGGPERLAQNAEKVKKEIEESFDHEIAIMELARQGHADNLLKTQDIYVLLDCYRSGAKKTDKVNEYELILGTEEGERKAFDKLSSNFADYDIALKEAKRRGLLGDRALSYSEALNSGGLASERFSEFNRTYQAATSLYNNFLTMARHTDRVERERGASQEVSLMWNQALLNLGAGMALSESADALQKAKENGWEIKLPEIMGKLRDEREGYIPLNSIHQARFLMADSRNVLLPQVIETSMETFLRTEREMSVGKASFEEILIKATSAGQKDEARTLAQQHTRLVFANSGYAYANEQWREIDLSSQEQAVLMQATYGSGGFGAALERYMEVGVVSKGISTEEERKDLYSTISRASGMSYAIAEQIIETRLRGETTHPEIALELMRGISSGARNIYEGKKAVVLEKESTERGIKGVGMFAIGTLGVATGFGAEVGLVMALQGLHELTAEERRGGGLDQMYRANKVGTVVQVTGAALGFLGGVAGTSSRIASEVVLAGRTTGMLGRFGMAFAEGTQLTTYINVPIMVASFSSDIVNIGLSIGAYNRGEMGLLELISSGLSPFQTVVQTGGSRIAAVDPRNRLWTERSVAGSAFRAVMLLGLGQTYGQVLRHGHIASIIDAHTARVEGDKIHATLDAPKRTQFDVMAKAIGIEDPQNRLLALRFARMGLDLDTTAAMMIDVSRSPEAARLVQAYSLFRDPANRSLKMAEFVAKFKQLGLTEEEIGKFTTPKLGEELGRPELSPKEALKILGESTFKVVKLKAIADALGEALKSEKPSASGMERARALYDAYQLHSQGKLNIENLDKLGLPKYVLEMVEKTAHLSPEVIARKIIADIRQAPVLQALKEHNLQVKLEKEREQYRAQIRDTGQAGNLAKEIGGNTYSEEHARLAVESAHAAATLIKKIDVDALTDEKLAAEVSKILPRGGTKESIEVVVGLLKDLNFVKAVNEDNIAEQTKIAAHRGTRVAADVNENAIVDAIWYESVAPLLDRSGTKPAQIYQRAVQLREEGGIAAKVAKEFLDIATQMPAGPEQELTLKLAAKAESEAKTKAKIANELEAEGQKRENEHASKALENMGDDKIAARSKEVAEANGLNYQAVEERAKQLRGVLKIGKGITDEQAKEHGFENAADAQKYISHIADKSSEKALDATIKWAAQSVAHKEGKLSSSGAEQQGPIAEKPVESAQQNRTTEPTAMSQKELTELVGPEREVVSAKLSPKEEKIAQAFRMDEVDADRNVVVRTYKKYERSRRLAQFAELSPEEQRNVLRDVHRNGTEKASQYLRDMMGLGALERQLGLPKDQLVDIYTNAKSLDGARRELANRLHMEITPETLAKSDDFFGALIGGGLLTALTQEYGKVTITRVTAILNSMEGRDGGLYKIDMIDSEGRKRTVYQKPGDRNADVLGSKALEIGGQIGSRMITYDSQKKQTIEKAYSEIYGRRNGALNDTEKQIVAEINRRRIEKALDPTEANIKVVINELAEQHSGLRINGSDGRQKPFGLSVDISQYQGKAKIGDVTVEIQALSVSQLGDMANLKTPAFNLLMTNPAEFVRKFGYDLAASIAAYNPDRHAANHFEIREFRLVKPTNEQLSKLGYRREIGADGKVTLSEIDGVPKLARLRVDDKGQIIGDNALIFAHIDNDMSLGYPDPSVVVNHLSQSGIDRTITILTAVLNENQPVYFRTDSPIIADAVGSEGAKVTKEGDHYLVSSANPDQIRMMNSAGLERVERPLHVYTVGEVREMFFGTEKKPGPIFEGVAKWLSEHGTDYQTAMGQLIRANRGRSVGMREGLTSAQEAHLETYGVAPNRIAQTGDVVVYADGRARLNSESEEYKTKYYKDAFPEGQTRYVIDKSNVKPELLERLQKEGKVDEIITSSDKKLLVFKLGDIPVELQDEKFVSVFRLPSFGSGDESVLRGSPGFRELFGLPEILVNHGGAIPAFRRYMSGMNDLVGRIDRILSAGEWVCAGKALVDPEYQNRWAGHRLGETLSPERVAELMDRSILEPSILPEGVTYKGRNKDGKIELTIEKDGFKRTVVLDAPENLQLVKEAKQKVEAMGVDLKSSLPTSERADTKFLMKLVSEVRDHYLKEIDKQVNISTEVSQQEEMGNFGAAARMARGEAQSNLPQEKVLEILSTQHEIDDVDAQKSVVEARKAFSELPKDKQQQVVADLRSKIESHRARLITEGSPVLRSAVASDIKRWEGVISLLTRIAKWNGPEGQQVEQAYGLTPGTLTRVLVDEGGKISNFLSALGINMPNTDPQIMSILHDRLLNITISEYPGFKITDITKSDTLNPVYFITMKNKDGKEETIFVKTGTHTASQIGSENLALSGMAVPKYITVDPKEVAHVSEVYAKGSRGERLTEKEQKIYSEVSKHLPSGQPHSPQNVNDAVVKVAVENGATLQTRTSDGQKLDYALVSHIGKSSEGRFSVTHNGQNHVFSTRTIAASDFENLSKNKVLMDILVDSSSAVAQVLGQLFAATLMTGGTDAHARNSWLIAEAIDNPTPERIAALKSKENQLITDEKGNKFIAKIVRMENGDYVLLKAGRIDTDDSAGAYWVRTNPDGTFNFEDIFRRFADPYAMHQLFESLAYAINSHLGQEAGANSTTAHYFNGADVAQRWKADILKGVEIWNRQIGQTREYQDEMIRGFRAHQNEPVGAGGLALAGLPQDLRDQIVQRNSGVSPHSFNGMHLSIIDREGRTAQVAEGERYHIQGANEPLHQLPDLKKVYLIKLTDNQQQVYLNGTQHTTFELGNSRFAVFDEINNVPAQLRETAISVTRNGNEIGASTGFGTLVGVNTEKIGAVPIFTALAIQGGLDSFNAITIHFLNSVIFWEKWLYDRATDPTKIGPDDTWANRFIQNYMRYRIPDAYANFGRLNSVQVTP